MALSAGARVGPYEVVGSLGRGGMGEVYRARDARLNRDVAIKTLPELFSMDPERISRFEREAQILASLNHPNIGGLYGLEESAGARYLVLELIPGESLAQRIAAGPVPLDEALTIARQVAEALEAAHDKGIVHRDLKPGNIMLTPEGQVKVLDFGLAKAVDPTDTGESGPPSGGFHPGLSPTFTSPAMTAVGLVIGTAAYMSPEQAKGRAADKRSDVWAFGCVLYEMLTGKGAFAGEDMSDTLADVLRGQPDWTQLPPKTPAPIERLVKRCLQKDRKQRLPDISIARYEIDEWLSGRSSVSATGTARPASRWRTAAMVVGGIVLGAAGASALFRFVLRPAPVQPTIARFEVKPPPNARSFIAPIGSGTDVVISADGSRIVYRVSTDKGQELALRRLEETESTILPGTFRAQSPSFSPKGDRIVYHRNSRLEVLVLGASAATVVCDLPGGIMGTDWLDDDTIVFAQRGLFRVAANGGKPEPIVQADGNATSFAFPAVTPDRRTLLFTVDKEGGTRHIAARTLASGEQKVVAENATFPRYVEPGRLVFMQGGRMVAAAFDPARLQLTGSPAPITESIVEKFTGAASFDVSATGTFAGMAGESLPYISRFLWKTRDGKAVSAVGTTELEYPRYPRISPDGRRLAATVGVGSRGQIWIFDLAGTAQPLKLTFAEHNLWPTWTPDGRSFVFTRVITSPPTGKDQGPEGIMFMPADGSVLTPKLLVSVRNRATSTAAVSPDGKWLLYAATNPGTAGDIMMKPLDKEGEERPWLNESFAENSPDFSPDGRLVAFMSMQTGSAEVWVRPFPGPGAPVRVSPSGGREPRWARNGRELFYQERGKMLAAAVVATSPELRFDTPRVLFEGGFVGYQDVTPRTYDVAADGRFLVIEEKPNPSQAIVTVVTGWSRLLPK